MFSSFAFCSQITDLVNVTKYHNKGYKGQGIKCAIVDNDWNGWSYLRDQGIVKIALKSVNPVTPLEDDYRSPYGHGTGIAQCFHEIAPEAEIYLINDNPGLTMDMITYFKGEGILLAVESLNNENFGINSSGIVSGNDPLSSVLDNCVSSSITVCTIVGNYANSSYFGHLVKDVSSNQMIFPNGTPNLDLVVSTNVGFNIYITRSGEQRPNSKYTGRLTNINTGWSENFNVDSRCFIRVIGPNANDLLRLEITKIADTVDYLDIIIGDLDGGQLRLKEPTENNKGSSVALPGASKKAITVGAILVSDYNKRDLISSISGWGPIPEDVDELGNIVVQRTIKPELCAPSEGGATSPTAPRVAGCLAVLASAGLCDLSKPEETKQYLLANHVVSIQPCPNNTFGYGRLFLDAKTDWPPPSPTPNQELDILICPNPVSLRTSNYLKIANFPLDVSRLDVRIYNINGEFVKRFSILELIYDINKKMLRWDLRNDNGDKVAPGVYFISIQADSNKMQIKKLAVKK
jgi:hypothetical protein